MRAEERMAVSTPARPPSSKPRPEPAHSSSPGGDSTCVVCFRGVDKYSVGPCDHPVCLECSTRMRVLCRQNECPICRGDMPQVIFTRHVHPYAQLCKQYSACPEDGVFGICFEDEGLRRAYDSLLEQRCRCCRHRPTFPSFKLLQEHVRREHELFYCDLCVEHLRIFTFERRCYSRKDLARHRRKGDPDDTSHRGHPNCEFCDRRYIDSDELYRHLRKDHLFCHFCDADGSHKFYSSYDYLREHFRDTHYLCEDGECRMEAFTSVFRTEIDLKAHKASTHSKNLGKAAAKQARLLELEFTLAPRRGEEEERRGGRKGHRRDPGVDVEAEPLPGGLDTASQKDFPTLLGGGAGRALVPQGSMAHRLAVNNGLTVRTYRPRAKAALDEEDFPSLGASVGANPRPNPPPQQRPNVSIRVSSSGAKPTQVAPRVTRMTSTNNIRWAETEDFPALGPGTGRSSVWTPHTGTGAWSGGGPESSCPKNEPVQPTPEPEKTKLTSLAVTPTFTALTKSKKKASSVMIPVGGANYSNGVKKVESVDPDPEPPPQAAKSELKVGSLSRAKGPPPGFASGQNPPPGFSPKDSPEHSYVQPVDFPQRNRDLVTLIKSLLDEAAFGRFRSLSGKFRGGQLSAEEYYWQCVDVLGYESFRQVFQELLVLLPDISRQQALLTVHRTWSRREQAKEESSSSFVECATCGQVLLSRDLKSHVTTHSLHNHFPSLPAASTSRITTIGSQQKSWRK